MWGDNDNDNDEPYYIENVVVTGSTALAIFVKSETSEELADETSIPKSQLHDFNEVSEQGDEGTLAVTKWLARERAWEA